MRRVRLAHPLLIALFALGLGGCRNGGDPTPVYVVAPSNFVRRVTAEGNLKAVKATPLSAPQQGETPLKIAWIADDGTLVRKDDLVVRFDATDFSIALASGRDDRGTADNKQHRAASDSSTTKTNLMRDARQAEEELAAARRAHIDDSEIFSRYQQIESELDEALAGEKRNHAQNVLGVREQLSKADEALIGKCPEGTQLPRAACTVRRHPGPSARLARRCSPDRCDGVERLAPRPDP